MSVLYILWFTYMSMKVCEFFINSSYLNNTWKVLLLPFATLSVLSSRLLQFSKSMAINHHSFFPVLRVNNLQTPQNMRHIVCKSTAVISNSYSVFFTSVQQTEKHTCALKSSLTILCFFVFFPFSCLLVYTHKLDVDILTNHKRNPKQYVSEL